MRCAHSTEHTPLPQTIFEADLFFCIFHAVHVHMISWQSALGLFFNNCKGGAVGDPGNS